MADDADKVRKNRDERRELIDGMANHSNDEFDDLSEVTRPDIKIELHQHRPSTHHPAPYPAAPQVPGAGAPRERQPSSGTIAELSDTLDKLPSQHRLWAFLALVLALLVAYLVQRGVWGGNAPVPTPKGSTSP